jgi:alanine racemase
MTRPPVSLEIHLDAICHNYERVKSYAPKSKIIAMVKANAYGHGLLACSKALVNMNVDALGVARYSEALLLRQAGVSQKIVLMQGFSSAEELQQLAELKVDMVLHDESQLIILENTRLSTPVHIWLKVNSGMNRLGFQPAQVDEVYNRLQKISHVIKPVYLMTHFSSTKTQDDTVTKREFAAFTAATKYLVGERSLAKSGAIIASPETQADWVRPGIMLYGVSPFEVNTGADYQLKPAMTLRSKIIAIRKQKKGDPIGYCGTWLCPEDMLVGVVAIGYGDGYPRLTQAGAPVLIHERRCGIIGSVNMDMMTVDLRNASQTKVGDAVYLWGAELPVEEVAKSTTTSPYEFLTRMGQREIP